MTRLTEIFSPRELRNMRQHIIQRKRQGPIQLPLYIDPPDETPLPETGSDEEEETETVIWLT